MTIAVEVDIVDMGEMACMWWTRLDQVGLYSALKNAAVTSQHCNLKSCLDQIKTLTRTVKKMLRNFYL